MELRGGRSTGEHNNSGGVIQGVEGKFSRRPGLPVRLFKAIIRQRGDETVREALKGAVAEENGHEFITVFKAGETAPSTFNREAFLRTFAGVLAARREQNRRILGELIKQADGSLPEPLREFK